MKTTVTYPTPAPKTEERKPGLYRFIEDKQLVMLFISWDNPKMGVWIAPEFDIRLQPADHYVPFTNRDKWEPLPPGTVITIEV
jgi:hypothetical protein